MCRTRLRALFADADPKVCTAFWFFGILPLLNPFPPRRNLVARANGLKGLINNVLYVIILTAALDLVGPSVPKGVVLLADVIPGFLMKLCGPYFIHGVPYSVRVLLAAALSTSGMLLVALTPSYIDGGTIMVKMAGVVLASISTGLGELSFMGLTHFYGHFSLAAWASGTGGAGLVGAGTYALATSLGVGITNTLLASSLLPIIMLVSFFVILPRGPLRRITNASKEHNHGLGLVQEHDDDDIQNQETGAEDVGLLRQSSRSSFAVKSPQTWQSHFLRDIRRSRRLFLP